MKLKNILFDLKRGCRFFSNGKIYVKDFEKDNIEVTDTENGNEKTHLTMAEFVEKAENAEFAPYDFEKGKEPKKEIGLIKNDDGTYTIRWNEVSNGKNYYSWGGTETGKKHEVTFKLEELSDIDFDRNIIHLGYGKLVYNIEPYEVVRLAYLLKELLPNLVHLEPNRHDERKMENHWINVDSIGLYMVGTATTPERSEEMEGSIISFRFGHTLILNDAETEYFVPMYEEIRQNKLKENIKDGSNEGTN